MEQELRLLSGSMLQRIFLHNDIDLAEDTNHTESKGIKRSVHLGNRKAIYGEREAMRLTKHGRRNCEQVPVAVGH